MAPDGPDLRELARRIERAQAEQLDRTGPGSSIDVGGGRAVMKGPRSPFSAALGLGLDGPVAEEELARLEAHLGLAGGPVRVQLLPFADGSLAELLARRFAVAQRRLGFRRSGELERLDCSRFAPPGRQLSLF